MPVDPWAHCTRQRLGGLFTQGCSCDPELGRLWLAVSGQSMAQLDHSMRALPKACKDLIKPRDNPCCARDTTLRAPC